MAKNWLTLLTCCCCSMTAMAQKTTTYDDRSGLSHWIVSDILQDQQGFIWLSTWNGLNRFDGYEFRQVKAKAGDGTDISSEVIRRMQIDKSGNIVCWTDGNQFMLDSKTCRLTDMPQSARQRMPEKKIPITFHDREGNEWRVERYGITKTSFPHHPAQVVAGTEEVQARAFLMDRKGRWWLATKEDECIRIFDRKNTLIGFLGRDGRIHQRKTPFGYRAYCIVQNRKGDIWIGCKPGALLRLREKDEHSFEIDNIQDKGLTCSVIYHIAEDSKGRLWLATFGGGVQCVPDAGRQQPAVVAFADKVNWHAKVRRILVTPSGNLACATTDGLLLVRVDQGDIRKSRFSKVVREGRRKESLAGNATMDVVQDQRGNIFIATENNGIEMTTEESLFGEKPVFRHFSKDNSSLTSDACIAMTLREDGHLFVVCSDRVLDFDAFHDQTVTFSRNFWNEACRFSEERPLPLKDGAWLVGLEQGAYIATNHHMNTRGYVPPLWFTDLHIDGKASDWTVSRKDTLTVEADERNFSLTFAALDYTDNAAICYRSRINGGEWRHEGSNRTLSFYDLAPGEYVLEVQSTDRYGRWVDNVRRLVVVVLPRWYETLWARLLGWLLSVAFVGGMVYTFFYIRGLHRQRQELLEKYMQLLHPQEEAKDDSAPKAETALGGLSENDRRFLEKVRTYIAENIGNSDANIDGMAAAAASSRSNLNRKLHSLVGITAGQLLIDARLQRARLLLKGDAEQGRLSVSEVAYRCGYTDPKYFSRSFKQRYGVSPFEFAEGA